MKTKSWLLASVACCGLSAQAGVVWNWTGAQDAYWTNAANWTVGGEVASTPPGKYLVPGVTDAGKAFSATNGVFDATAEFGAVTDGNATTVNLDGFWDVSNLTVKAGAPRYTFGTAATQSLTVHSTAGVFRVEADAPAPTIVAHFGCWRYQGVNSSQLGNVRNPKVWNDSSETLVFDKMFYIEGIAPASTGEKAIEFRGTGDVKVSGLSTYRCLVYLDLYQTNGGKLIWDCDVRKRWDGGGWNINGVRKIRCSSSAGCEIELTERGVLSGYNGMGPFDGISGNVTLSGAGTYLCNVAKKADDRATDGNLYIDQQNDVWGTLTVLAHVVSVTNSVDYQGGWCRTSGTGTTVFGDNNDMTGWARILTTTDYSAQSAHPTFSVAKIGLDGEKSPLGYAGIAIAAGGCLRYTGPGETCTKAFVVTNRVSGIQNAYTKDSSGYAILEQAGTGKLVFDSAIRSYGVKIDGTSFADATLELSNVSASEAEIGQALADNVDRGKLNLKKTGSGLWRLLAANTYTGKTTVDAGTLAIGPAGSLAADGSVVLNGGTLAIEADGARSVTLPPLSVAKGANRLTVPDGATVTLAGLTATGGAMDIVTAGSGSVKVSGAGASTVFPVGVTLNGKVAEFDADGNIAYRSYSIDVEIAARGGRIPNGADKTVGITSAGAEDAGPVKLADGLSAATVAALVQKTATPATVAFEEGQTLQATTVARTKGAEALEIGAADGKGELKVSGKIEFDSADTKHPIVVNAAFKPATSASVANVGEGLTRITSPFDWAGTLSVMAGTLALSNDAQTAFSSTLEGPGELRKEGAGNWTLTKDQSAKFTGDFTVAGGTVTVDNFNKLGNASGTVTVTNGGTLVASKYLEVPNGKRLVLSGSGAPGAGGALVPKKDGFFMPTNVVLAGDTVIHGEAPNTYVQFGYFQPTVFDMQGHRLVFGGDSYVNLTLSNTKIVNPGVIEMERWPTTANTWKTITFADTCDLGDENDPEILVHCGFRSSLPSKIAPRRRLVIDVDPTDAGPMGGFTGGMAAEASGVNTNSCWAGPIEIRNANTYLSFHPWDADNADRWIAVSGQISGEGGIDLGAKGKSGTKGHVVLTHPNNTYRGTTTMNGGNAVSIHVHHLGSIPDWSKLTVPSGNRVALRVGEGLFSRADLMTAFNSAATLSYYTDNGMSYGPGTLTVDTALAPGNEYELTLSDADITRDDGRFSLGHDGPGSLTLRGPFTKPVNVSCFEGTLKLTGDDRITLGAGVVAGNWRKSTGVLLLDNAKDVVQNGKTTIALGGANGSSPNLTRGEMVIRNSKLVRERYSDALATANSYYSGILVGYVGEGILTIEGDSVVTNHINLGYSGTGARGGLHIKGGIVCESQGGKSTSAFVGANYGYVGVMGGFYDVAGLQRIGQGGGYGVFEQRGGRIEIHQGVDEDPTYNGSWNLAADGGSKVSVYFGGGVCTNRRDTAIGSNANNSKVYFTVDGGEFVCLRPANPNRASGDSLNVFNLNGGVFSAWNLARAQADSSYTGKPEAYVNFNGGTYRVNRGYSLFGQKGGGAWANAVDNVTVFEKGATIEVPNGLEADVDVPMAKPSGKGVAYIPWNDTTTEFVGAPFVDIVKDEGSSGWGATAMAVYDPDTRRVSAIRITSPGCDYEPGRVKAHIVYPGSRTWTNAVTLADNATTGSFTKKGAGTLVLRVANTYGGDTVIEDGTLRLEVDGAIPEASSIVMKGGMITAAEGVSLPAMNFKFVLGETFASTGSISFPEGSTVTVDNLDALDPEAREYVLATYEKGVSGTAEFLQESDLPSGWKFSIGTKKIKISRAQGTLLILR